MVQLLTLTTMSTHAWLLTSPVVHINRHLCPCIDERMSQTRHCSAAGVPPCERPETEAAASSRRRLFQATCIGILGTVAFTTNSQPAVAAEEDPFAQLDSIASTISSSDQLRSNAANNYPMSPSPLPKGEGISNEQGRKLSNDGSASSNVSEMEEALRESRKRKRVDPRTHG